ncbi:MAG: DUF5668 domain-containing protein [Candidatus Thermoplasmatota archaeon]
MEIEEKIDRGANIVWYGAVFAGTVVILVGVLWLLDNQKIIVIDIWTVCSLVLIVGGAAVIAVGLWLRSLLRS